MNLNFVAIDLETANPDLASICQIGLVKCVNGVLSDENQWKTYVDPEDYFHSRNIDIHKIKESDVKGAPTFPELTDKIHSYLEDTIVVCHMRFDQTAMHLAAQRYGVSMPTYTWLDSAQVVRRTWKECAQKGYRLDNICKILGYDFKHHDALEDAKAVAHIMLAAADKSGLDIEGLLKQVRQPIVPEVSKSGPAIKSEANPEGAFYGNVLVFTGSLKSLGMSRNEAKERATAIGCQVAKDVTQKTTLLVVGDQDIKRLAGHKKSAKHRKAEKFIGEGIEIKILTESNFKELVKRSEE